MKWIKSAIIIIPSLVFLYYIILLALSFSSGTCGIEGCHNDCDYDSDCVYAGTIGTCRNLNYQGSSEYWISVLTFYSQPKRYPKGTVCVCSPSGITGQCTPDSPDLPRYGRTASQDNQFVIKYGDSYIRNTTEPFIIEGSFYNNQSVELKNIHVTVRNCFLPEIGVQMPRYSNTTFNASPNAVTKFNFTLISPGQDGPYKLPYFCYLYLMQNDNTLAWSYLSIRYI